MVGWHDTTNRIGCELCRRLIEIAFISLGGEVVGTGCDFGDEDLPLGVADGQCFAIEFFGVAAREAVEQNPNCVVKVVRVDPNAPNLVKTSGMTWDQSFEKRMNAKRNRDENGNRGSVARALRAARSGGQMTARIIELWLEGAAPAFDGIYRSSGRAHSIEVDGPNLSWFDIGPQLDMDQVLGESDDVMEIDVCAQAQMPGGLHYADVE